MSSAPPVLYGKYQLLSLIARGGMAEVFKAKAHGVEGFEKVLVIKRILPELGENPRFTEMFINEAKIAVTLSHANIVQVFDLGHAGGTYFIAMEYVAGMDLNAMLKQGTQAKRPLKAELAVYIISELAKGLDYAHRRRDGEMRPLNIVHRDVSPQNILLSYEGEVKLTDFGIAKARTMVQAVTELGVVKGKYAYMAPEQLLGSKLDARTDLFAAGTLFYEALSGVNPFQAGSTYDTLQRIRSGQVTPLEKLAPDTPAEVCRIVRKCMAALPDERYPSAGHLYEELIQFLYGTGKRVGARDLAEHLAALKAGVSEEPSRLAQELEAAFGDPDTDPDTVESGPEPTRVVRGTKVGRQPRRDPQHTPHRERSEYRDVTALVMRLAADDELGQRTIETLVERFGGKVLGALEEDDPKVRSVATLFGHLNPDGRDTEHAARCALKAARAGSAAAASAGKSSSLAVGLASGRVLVDHAGGLAKDDRYRTLMTAALKLAQEGGEGQIMVDEPAERALRSRFRLVPVAAASGQAHVLANERSMADAYGRFVGRREPLKQIGETLAKANQGKLRVIGLQGDAGVGKSRLIVETMRRLGLAGHNVGLHVAQLTPQMQETPLSAITEMLRVVLGVDEFDQEPLLRDRTTRLRELGLLNIEQAAVSAALGLKGENPKRGGRRPLRAALLRIIRKLAEDRLTIFTWDSAEYLDEESFGIIDDMLRSITDARVAMILSYRPGYQPRWVDLPGFREIQLPALEDDDVAKLVATRLGAEEIPFELLREVTTKSGGNPLYVEEYLKALQEAGTVSFRDGQVGYDPKAAAVDVPKTLRGIVASRVARLGATPRYLLQVAAIVGERFNPEIVAGAAEEDVATLLDMLAQPELEGITHGRGTAEYGFAHDLVRQVLMESITLQARREIHAAVAATLERLYPEHSAELAGKLARHFREAGETQRAVEQLAIQAERLERDGALDGAMDAIEEAIEILATAPGELLETRLKLYLRVAELCFRNRSLSRGASIMEKALKVAEARRAEPYIARFSLWRGRMLVAASRVEEGRRWLDQAMHVARGLTDRELSRDVFVATADANARSGEFENAVGYLREAHQLSRESGDLEAEVRCLLPLALTFARMGDHNSALATLVQVKQLADALADPMVTCHVYRLESQIYYHARDQVKSAAAAAKAVEVAREAGLPYETALNAHNMGEAYLRQGDHRRAFSALRTSYELAIEHGYTRLQMSNMRALGFIDATRFGSAEGRNRILKAIEYAAQHEYVWDLIQGKYLLAIVEQGRGEVEKARAVLREVLTLAAQHGHRNYTADAEHALKQLDAGTVIGVPQ
jgi:predicted ATPase/tRNA A-37 threonylcarbamoyl transferase component Bud32